MSNNNFSQFTNLYELSKTLRFELKPVGKTQNLLKENEVFPKDQIVYESYKKIRPFLDDLHIKFIEESLSNLKLKLEEIERIFLENSKKTKSELTKEDKDEFNKIKINLRKQISKYFNLSGENWKKIYESKTYLDDKEKEKNYKIKGDGYKILLSDTNLDILSEIYTEKK